MCPQCVPFEDRKSKLASTVDSYLPRSAWDPSPTPLSKERMVDRGGVRVWLQLGLDCERLCSCPHWEALWLPPAPGKDVGGCGLRSFGDRGPDKSSSAKREVQAFFKSNLIKRSWTTKTYSKLMNWDSQCKREYSFSPSLCR